MITSFEFETVEELQDFVENAKDKICSCILYSIEQALEEKEDEPVVFDMALKESLDLLEMYLHKDSWVKALNACLSYFTDNNFPDQAIDAYLLLEKIKDNEVEVMK